MNVTKLLGVGWKTLTGAVVWAVAHVGLVAAVADVVKPGSGESVAAWVAKAGAALAAIGLAHKAERFDRGG